jgi:tetratricopeptide (TPR) repeat protein
LRALQRLAGFVQASNGDEVTALPPTTISWVLKGKGLPKLPRLEFVDLYVTACLRACGQPDSVIVGELQLWRRAWRRLAAASGDETNPNLRIAPAAPEKAPAGRPTAGLAMPMPRPTQLPSVIPGFIGRREQLRQLERHLGSEATRCAAVVISAIAGMAGVGKTALAVYWAHRVAGRFGDGQLYVNLRAFDPTASPMSPQEALRGFLHALGIAPQQVPADPDAQGGLYRSLLAGRRMLVVLDNARDAAQVRPLLPGAPGCLVVVTSRNQLSSLVAAEGAHPITLDVPSANEARDLLAARLGEARVDAEPGAVNDIIDACARLPLALAVVGARAATHPSFSLQALASELRETRGRLDTLTAGDAAADVRAALSWSYEALSPPAARLFCLLGIHPGPDITISAVASIAGIAVRQAGRLLSELTGTHLLTERRPGRYELHDLLRAYAIELAHTLHTEADLRTATHQLLDHYLRTADTAAMLLNPHWEQIALPPACPGVTPEDITDHERALAWFTAERPVLLSVVEQAAAAGFDVHTWRLSWALIPFLDLQGHWQDWSDTQRTALEAARRTADRTAQAHSHRAIARAYLLLDRSDDAETCLREAMDLYRDLDDRTGLANAHRSLGNVFERLGRHQQALHHALQALDLYRVVGDRVGTARTLNAIGWCLALLGEYEQTLTYCQEALDMQRELGHLAAQAATLDSLGYAQHHLGRHQQAITCYQRAIALFHRLGERHGEADTLTRLAETYRTAGDDDAACRTWRQALEILDELGHPDADHVRSKIYGAARSGTRPMSVVKQATAAG